MIEQARNILKSVFGYDAFISLQEDVIRSVLGGKDCLAVMPTGGGKSLCYQIPALIFSGLTVVVSPLISLMKDQTDQLTQLGVPAVLLNSLMSPDSYRQSVERIRTGEARLLYTAPETLIKPNVLALLDARAVSCLAIDEAHCISEWGHDFRPEYRQLAEVRARMPQTVCIALTATATPRVRKDIKNSLGLDDSNEFIASFNRENLLIRVVPKDKPLRQTVEFLRKYPGDPGIIYGGTRRRVDDLCAALEIQGLSVIPYHAGLSDEERELNQEKFVRDEVRIIAATIAFGMGIDKSNIRFVLHYDLPKSVESYYQEIGRSGRDGMRAECVLLFSYADIHKTKYFIARKEGLDKRAASLQLDAMLRFAEADICRRIPLLAYFGEDFGQSGCGMCDNCLSGEKATRDITVPSQKFLSCVKRTGERFGMMHIINVLRGSKSSKLLNLRHDKLSTYAIGKDLSPRQWQQVARQLLHKGLMVQDPEIGGLSLAPRAWDVFRGKEKVLGSLDDDSAEPEKPPDTPSEPAENRHDPGLFEVLREKRKELADAANVPPYVIFSDRTLVEMATCFPRTPDVMLGIHGVGEAKLDRYGPLFIELIADYCRDHKIEQMPAPPRTVRCDRENRGSLSEIRVLAIGGAFNSGRSIEELARQFSIKAPRVLEYLLSYCRDGHPLRPEGFVPLIMLPAPEQERAFKAFEVNGPWLLRPVFDALNGEIGYEDLKVLRLYYLALRGPAGGFEPDSCGKREQGTRINSPM
jgi:ATP-dependent DNA helicase RecQ